MEVMIYCNGSAAGRAELISGGLYWEITCRLEQPTLTRLYGVEGWDSQYLGIPGAEGVLHTRIGKKHMPRGFTAIIGTQTPKGDWKPWMGTVDGVEVTQGWLQPTKEGFLLGLPGEECLKFPEWVEQMVQIQVYGMDLAAIGLDPEGHLPLIERESRGTENEEIDRNDSGDDLPADSGPGDGISQAAGRSEEDGGQTDRPDL